MSALEQARYLAHLESLSFDVGIMTDEARARCIRVIKQALVGMSATDRADLVVAAEREWMVEQGVAAMSSTQRAIIVADAERGWTTT